MKEELRKNKITNLAFALHEKGSIKGAAAAINIDERTAHRWLQDPNNLEIIINFNREVRTRGAIILAEGKLGAYENLVQLSQSANSDSVQLKACLAIIELDFPLMSEMEQDLRATKMERLFHEFGMKGGK